MNWIQGIGERDESRSFNYNGEDWSKSWVRGGTGNQSSALNMIGLQRGPLGR